MEVLNARSSKFLEDPSWLLLRFAWKGACLSKLRAAQSRTCAASGSSGLKPGCTSTQIRATSSTTRRRGACASGTIGPGPAHCRRVAWGGGGGGGDHDCCRAYHNVTLLLNGRVLRVTALTRHRVRLWAQMRAAPVQCRPRMGGSGGCGFAARAHAPPIRSCGR